MRGRALAIVVALLIGVLVNVGVAWLFAVTVSTWESDFDGGYVSDEHGQWVIVKFESFGSTSFITDGPLSTAGNPHVHAPS